MTEEAAAPRRTRLSSRAKGVEAAGRLRIGDDWNAITIIALMSGSGVRGKGTGTRSMKSSRLSRLHAPPAMTTACE